jgi:hypothetical protein
METQLSPLQLDATSGVGKTLIVPDPERIVRFLICGKVPPTGGEITIECCPMKAPGISEGGQMIVFGLRDPPLRHSPNSIRPY